MKKLVTYFLIGIITVVVAGCGQVDDNSPVDDVKQMDVGNYKFERNPKGEVDIMKESTRIQLDKTLSKKEKGELLKNLQQINREQMNAKIKK